MATPMLFGAGDDALRLALLGAGLLAPPDAHARVAVSATLTDGCIAPDDAIIAQIAEVSRRVNPNEKTISPAIQKQAHDLLVELRDRVAGTPMEWRHPNISSEGGGDILFEWIVPGQRILSIHIAADGAVEYLKAWGLRLSEDMEEGVFGVRNFGRIWRWFTEAV